MNGRLRASEGPEGQGSSESEDHQQRQSRRPPAPAPAPAAQPPTQATPLYTALNRGSGSAPISSPLTTSAPYQYRPHPQAGSPFPPSAQPLYRIPSPAQPHPGPHRYPSQDHVPPVRNLSKLDRTASRESITLQATNQQNKRAQEEAMSKQGYNLRPSPNNRLFLSLRSGIPSEIDYAIEELVRLTHQSRIVISDFPGSVEALLDLVEPWIEDVERETVTTTTTSTTARRKIPGQGDDTQVRSFAGILGLGKDAGSVERERRATDALLILRNAVFAGEDVENALARQNKQVVLWVKTRPTLEQVAVPRVEEAMILPPRVLSLITRLYGGLDEVDSVSNVRDDPVKVAAAPSDQLKTVIPGVSIEGLSKATMKRPEPMLYILDLLIALLPSLIPLLEESEAPVPDEQDDGAAATVTTAMLTARMLRPLICETLPELFLTTGDVGFIIPLAQLFTLVPAQYLPSAKLIPKLISFLLLTPAVGSGRINRSTGKIITQPSPYPPELLTNSLNLLYHITQEMTTSLSVLKDPEIVNYLRILTRLVKWDARELSLALKHTGQVGKYVEVPEPGASRYQTVDRTDSHGKHYSALQTVGVALKQDDGKDETGEKVGLGPVVRMSDEKRRRIRSMKEPERAHTWMADTFVSQPESSVTQVVFWKAYSAFVQQAMPDEPPVPASGTAGDVIKSATTVFPAANAMVINKDDKGQPLPQNLFVIAGMRFKRSAGRLHTFACRWEGCSKSHSNRNPEELYAHLKAEHGTEPTSSCRWHSCRSKSSSATHLVTHVPPPIKTDREPKIKRVLIHPESSAESVKSTFLTYRQPPILPREYGLHYTGIMSPVDIKGQPASDAFFASLVLRNLGKALRIDTERVENEQDAEDPEGGRRARKRRKMEREGAFGLPAPPGLLDADMAITDTVNGSADIRLSATERARARDAFGGIVEKTVLEVLGMEGAIAAKLLDCVGF